MAEKQRFWAEAGAFSVALGVLVVLVGMAAPSRAQTRAQADLSWKWQKDQELRYEFVQTSTTRLAPQEQNVESPSSLTIGWTWKVAEVSEEGVATVHQTVDYVRGEIRMGPESIRFDSQATPDANAEPEGPGSRELVTTLLQLYEKVIGKSYVLTIGPTGVISAVQPPGGLSEALRGSPALTMADSGSVFSADGLKNMLTQVIPPVPGKFVPKGEHWNSSMSLPAGPLVMTIDTSSELTEAESSTATITATIGIAARSREGTNLKVEVKDQSGSGEVRFDTKAGCLVASEVRETFSLALSTPEQTLSEHVNLKLTLRRRASG
jgi:hypothetical protein